VLIDRQILEAIEAGDLVVEPGDGIIGRIQPASLDVRLGHTFAVYRRDARIIDLKADTSHNWTQIRIESGDYFVLGPNELILAATLESIGLGDHLVARVEGKSSLGRLGLLVHATAGFIDPGWPLAPITLEISSVIGVPMKLYPGMPVAQLAFETVEPVATGYSGKYVGQQAPTPSRFHENWTGTRWI
jgi:dCTP deaminase